MICLSIGTEGMANVKKALSKVQMAEIRLDLTHLAREETVALFKSKKALVATCRMYQLSPEESRERLLWAIEGSPKKGTAGQRYIDLDYDSPHHYRNELITAARGAGFKVILSYHNFQSTGTFEQLCEIYEAALERGADIVKIVTTAVSLHDSATLLKLYKKVPPHTLLAFAVNKEGRFTRIVSKMAGAPFIYCSLEDGGGTAAGQFSITQAKTLLSRKGYPIPASRKAIFESVMAPASKSHAQRAILSAAFAKGTTTLHQYTPCADSEAALGVISSLGVTVKKKKSGRFTYSVTIESSGIDEWAKSLPEKGIVIDVGESGLLCRLMIPLSGLLIAKSGGIDSVTITGRGSLLKRKLFSDQKALNDIGIRVETVEGHLPAVIRGAITGAHFKASGKDGSQLLSGMLMALPLCDKESHIELAEPTSIAYIDLTIKTLKEFGIDIQNNGSTAFTISAFQKYENRTCFPIEGDWSGASMLVVAGAISHGVTVANLPIDSKQSDEKILEVLKMCGVKMEFNKADMGSTIVIPAPANRLIPFETDATDCPDLFPALVVLALNCNGTSRIKGLHRLFNKESNRAESLYAEFTKLGANIEIIDDYMIVEGGKLHGGFCSSHNDHRIGMALVTASLNIKEEVYVDDLHCISKSFPNFIQNFK